MEENAHETKEIAFLERRFTIAELFGKEVLFSNEPIDKENLPKGLYCYYIRHKNTNWGAPITVEPYVLVNRYGAILSKEPIELNGNKEYPNDPYRIIGAGDFKKSRRKPSVKEWLSTPPELLKQKEKTGKTLSR